MVDADPADEHTIKNKAGNSQKVWRKCYPFQYPFTQVNTYKPISGVVQNLLSNFTASNIKICVNRPIGKTLEYDLAFLNPACKLLLTPAIQDNHIQELETLMDEYSAGNSLSPHATLFTDINNLVTASPWPDLDQKNRSVIAAYYLKAVESAKGAHASYFYEQLLENFEKEPTQRVAFVLPQNIQDAFDHVC